MAGEAEPSAALCRDCRAAPPPLAQMRAPLRYEEPTSRLIHRLKYEGYFALARPLAEGVGVPFSATALRRTRHTAPQVGLGPEARAANVQGAFDATAGEAGGCSILLIDDVLTTGATMTAAAAALLAAGAVSVSAYCLARVS